jgi:hypothetical protein
VYAYLQAAFLYHADKIKHGDKILELMKSVPTLTRKIAGKSIPFEVFFFTNNRNLFPVKPESFCRKTIDFYFRDMR